MNLESFLLFVMKHNTTIIEALIGCTLLITLVLAIRSFLIAKEPEGAASLAGLGDLEATLKKILEQASHVPSSGVVAAAGGSEDGQKLVGEIEKLKVDLATKQKQIEEMKATAGSASPAAAGGISEEEKAKLEAQLKELQAKLSEYEIISEDIADLSFYKEQNVKLQKELEALKGGAPAAAPAAAAPVAAPAPPPPPAPEVKKSEPEIVGKSKVEEGAVAAPSPAPSAPPAPAPGAPENVVDNELMAEFAAAVEQQKSTEASVDLGAMDVDKMMAEAAAIKTSDGPEVSAEQALGTGLDESKLLQEATALQGVTSEDKKLMGQFENFVKKSE